MIHFLVGFLLCFWMPGQARANGYEPYGGEGDKINHAEELIVRPARQTVERYDRDPKRMLCEVNYAETPQLLSFAQTMARFCGVYFPRVRAYLDNRRLEPPYLFVLKRNVEQHYAGEAFSDKKTICVSTEGYTNRSTEEEFGLLIHEMAHIATGHQRYKQHPGWLEEGLADYVRNHFTLDQNGAWRPNCSQQFRNYADGYQCAAAFLIFIERKYWPRAFKKEKASSNMAAYWAEKIAAGELADNAAVNASFVKTVGKTLPALWRECSAPNAECGPTAREKLPSLPLPSYPTRQ